MTTRYVDMAAGSDAADGLTTATPKLTLAGSAAGWVAGDVVNVRGTGIGIGHLVVTKTIDNLTIQQWEGEAQALWCGSSAALTPGTWVDVGGGFYTYALPSGLGAGAVGAILFNYYAQQTARGSHFGALKLSASAAAVDTDAGAAPTKGFFFYTTATGSTRAYFGGDAPGFGVTHYVARDTAIAIELTGTGNVVDGIHFKAWHQANQGACVWLKDGTGSSVIRNCSSWDCSNHAFVCSGQSVLMANASISNCRSFGALAGGAHFTFFQVNGFGNTTGLTFSGCHVERHSYLGIDEEEIATCTQTGWYCHSDAGTPLRDVQLNSCTSYDVSVVDAPIAAAGTATPTSETTFSGHYARAQDCNFQNMSRYINSDNHFAFRRCILGIQRSGSSTKCRYGAAGALCANAVGGRLLFESCLIIMDSGNDAAQSVVGITGNSTGISYFFNCTIVDLKSDSTTAQATMVISYDTANTLVFRGCILSFVNNTTDQQSWHYAPGASHTITIDDNAWGLFPDGYGTSGQGTNALDLDYYPLGSDYRVLSSVSLYSRRRATSTNAPASLIGATYDGSYGAYAYLASAINTRSRVTNDAGRQAFRAR